MHEFNERSRRNRPIRALAPQKDRRSSQPRWDQLDRRKVAAIARDVGRQQRREARAADDFSMTALNELASIRIDLPEVSINLHAGRKFRSRKDHGLVIERTHADRLASSETVIPTDHQCQHLRKQRPSVEVA